MIKSNFFAEVSGYETPALEILEAVSERPLTTSGIGSDDLDDVDFEWDN